MKKSVILIFLCLIHFSCNKPQVDKCENAHLWSYSDEWRSLPLEQRADALQIPEIVLQCLSTEELTDLCLQYPLIDKLFSFDLIDDGLDELFSDFNGIRELYQRNDVANSLLERYKKQIQNLITGEPIYISIFKFDVLLSRVKEQNAEILTEILRELVIGYETITMLEIDNKFLLPFNYFSRAHVIIKISDEYLNDIPFGKTNPVFAPAEIDSETTEIINQISYQLIEK